MHVITSPTKDSYKEVEIVPDHEYIEYFAYDVRFPQLNEDITCSEVVNEEVLRIMNSFVKEVEDTLNYYTPEDAEPNGDRFFEQLWINYDFVEKCVQKSVGPNFILKTEANTFALKLSGSNSTHSK